MTARAASVSDTPVRTFGLYVHLPWCARKCPYCDFNSFESRGRLPERDYVAALLRDLDHESEGIASRTVTSIYIGGGTPSLFSAESIGRLLEGVCAAVNVSSAAEITLEANPGAIEAARFDAYREAGVNRVSIGVQSLRDEQLARLGRVHNSREARAAVAGAMSAGFDSVNLDLMYGLPGDTMQDGREDLERAIALGTPHLSWYQLTLEPNTAWERRPPPDIPDDDIVAPLESAGREMLAAAGLGRYEVSAYARPGHQCEHNLNYWRFLDYVGIGAGAHSKRTLTQNAGHERYSKLRNPQSFMNMAGSAACITARESVTEPRAVALEYFMNTLRLTDGTTQDEFNAVTGRGATAFPEELMLAGQHGLLRQRDGRLQATEQGMSRLNSILRLLC